MLKKNELIAIAEKYIELLNEMSEIELLLIEDWTKLKPLGAICYYQSKRFWETRDDKYILLAPAPFVVKSDNGQILTFGTKESMETYISWYNEGVDFGYEIIDDFRIDKG